MIVLDANILVRAVLGRRVRQLIERYSVQGVRFAAPDEAFRDAERYLPSIIEKRNPGIDVPAAFRYLRQKLEILDAEVYSSFEQGHIGDSRDETRRTGQCLPVHSHWVAQFGRKIQTSSVQHCGLDN